MNEIVTKGEFAELLGVERPTVSTWIARGQLTAPALLADGRINFDLGKQQLAARIDLAKSRGRAPGGLFANVDKPTPASGVEPIGDDPTANAALKGYGARIAKARGDLLQLELDRRELHRLLEDGHLIRVADRDREVLRKLSLLIVSIDGGLLPEWVVAIRGATTPEQALAAIEERIDRLWEWQQP
jgi:hypothetical protein